LSSRAPALADTQTHTPVAPFTGFFPALLFLFFEAWMKANSLPVACKPAGHIICHKRDYGFLRCRIYAQMHKNNFAGAQKNSRFIKGGCFFEGLFLF
jgi:hypothetical protein